MASLLENAERHGIAVTYQGADGKLTRVPKETLKLLTEALSDSPVPHPDGETASGANKQCFLPEFLEAGRAWGISLQLYELRSDRNAGIGDFADLADFCRIAGPMGADFVGCNPLHALFLADLSRCSPFFPSNRRFLNPIYIAVDKIACVTWTDHQHQRAERLRAIDLVDYVAVAELKLELLRDAWVHWKDSSDLPRAEFTTFKRDGGEPLRKHALFETLSQHFARGGEGAGWRGWPASYQDWRSPEVAVFARENKDEIEFHIWLQWIAAGQLAAARKAARSAGMRIGLYLDLAVAEAPDGSATWSEPENFLLGMKIGAPPDVFSADGQDWGLAPLSPVVLGKTGDGYYKSLLQRVMAMGGALRIDHAMSAARLFIIPEALAARDGTYLRFPIEAVLTMYAALSQRLECVVIAEDLGNVPAGFRDALEAARMLSYRVLCFEHRAGEFHPSSSYPRLSLACVTTHDLPPIRAWWQGEDISLRQTRGLIDAEAAARQLSERGDLVKSLWRVARSGQTPSQAGTPGPAEDDVLWQDLAVDLHRFIAGTPSVLMAARLADMTGDTTPTNIPGTAEDYPNWRPKSSLTLSEFSCSPMANAIARALSRERPR